MLDKVSGFGSKYMKHEIEHLNLDKKGDLLGLWDIDVKKATGLDMWDKIQSVIEAYAKVHSLEMEILVRQNLELSRTRKNSMALTEEGGNRLRWGMNIPHGLMFKLELLEPMLFSDKKLYHKFLKKYKGFRVCETV